MLLEYIEGALCGRQYYQVTVNIRGKDAETVARSVASNPLTGGLLGPTVSPVYSAKSTKAGDEQWYTATIIIASKNLLQAVEHLRTIGGVQAIATPVRYIFMEQSSTYAKLLDALEA